jgi:hypothetical protein
MTKAVAVRKAAAVLGFVSREDYVEFRTVCVDGAALPSDYGAFMKDYNQHLQSLRAEGISPTQMSIKPAQLVAWCNANGRAVDSKSRVQYANFVFAGLNFKK